ncbi:MAG: nucleotidyltransferase domain-containing protein [Candidatus Jettenia sp. CY-1]|nr:MAG: nucleotidyltransferase domain-containing protein [Candidatus Jettenia sp. CY-1]
MDKRLYQIVANVKHALEVVGVHIAKIILFGSYAQGTTSEYSDIDIAIISNDFKDKNLLQRLELIGEALAKARIMDSVEIMPYHIQKKNLSQKKKVHFYTMKLRLKV